MTVAQVRNAEMVALLSADLLSSKDKNVAIEVYDFNGGQDFSSATPFTVNLDTARFNFFPEVFTLSSNILTVLEAGIYQVNWRITVGYDSGFFPAAAVAWLEEDPATGTFVEVHSSKGFLQLSGVSWATVQIVNYLHVAANSRYRLRLARDGGSDTLTTLPRGASLSVMRLLKAG